jgi:hypothetical protein
VASRPSFLFPTRVMAALVRGKVMAGLKAARAAGELGGDASVDAALPAAWRHPWVVHVEAPDGRAADQAVKYLARYVGGTAIGDARMVAVTRSTVTFRTRRGPHTLPGAEFVRRFAQHVLPKRLRRVRYYGLYAPSNAHTRLAQARRVLGMPPTTVAPAPSPLWTCPVCGRILEETRLPGVPWLRPRVPPRARGSP